MTTPLSDVLDDARAHELSARDLWYSEEDYWKERLEELSVADCNTLEAMAENYACPTCEGVNFEVAIFQRVVFDVHCDPATGIEVSTFRLHSDLDGSWQIECANPACKQDIEGSGWLYKSTEDQDRIYEALIDAVNAIPTQQYERSLA